METPLGMPKQQRTWPALLALIAISPGVGELLSGSTPPLLIIQPFALIFLPPLYGASAVLIHDAMVRRHLGWGNVLLLGAAFGVFQEGLVVQTWFTYMIPGSPSHSGGIDGALGGINWIWALSVSMYHAFVSITIPILLLGLLMPRRAKRPFLGRKGRVALVIWLIVLNSFLAFSTATTQFAKQGYHGPPPLAYLLTVGIMVALIVLGLTLRFPTWRVGGTRLAPRPLTVGFFCALCLVVYFIALSAILPTAHLPAPVMLTLSATFVGWVLWRIVSWAARPGWNDRHRFAIVLGVVGYFAFFWGPLVEFVVHLPQRVGMTAVDVIVFIVMALYARRVRQHVASEADITVASTPEGVVAL